MKKTDLREIVAVVRRQRELSQQWRPAKQRFDAAPKANDPGSKRVFAEAHQALTRIEAEQDQLWQKFDQLSRTLDIERLESAVDVANAVRELSRP